MDVDGQTDRRTLVKRVSAAPQHDRPTSSPIPKAAENAEMTDWSAATNHTTHHPHHMGGHKQANPADRERGRQDRSRAIAYRSAHSERGQSPSRGHDFGGPSDGGRGGMEVKVEFGSAPGEGRAGQTECIFLLSWVGVPFFVWRLGEKEDGMAHYDGASSSGVGKGYS